MGRPAENPAADGDTIYFYPHQPRAADVRGAHRAAGRVRPVGRRSPRKIEEGAPGRTSAQAREIFTPRTSSPAMRMQREVWEYDVEPAAMGILPLPAVPPDGILREAHMLKDYSKEMGDSKGPS
jgi:hypothetical protein